MINNIFIKICLVLLIFISGGYFAYQYYQNSKPVITIYADELPARIKPIEAEKSLVSTVHSTIYESLISKDTNIKAAKLLPEPEKPINIISRNQTEEPTDEISHLISLLETDDNDNVPYKQAEDKKFETDLNIIKLNKETKNGNLKATHSSDSYKIQLGSVKSETEAIEEGERIKKKFPKILKNAVITTKKVKYADGKFFYLILAGNYDSISQAKAVCKKLSYQKQSCILK
ncbi:MAG TPA: SPOR domain-containing protein [Rickettsia endosymbiont of Pyrocoelia pectoralis]|nr:SPOR domain-containing protein [Rickettsia endosymbiont of Pyrocoelia pectoralis]